MLSGFFLAVYFIGFVFGSAFLFVENGWFMLTVSWVVSAGGILSGIGLLLRRPWARSLAIATSVPGLFFVPLGTAVSIYAFWALSRPHMKLYLAIGRE
jgi:hypothetical protein